MALLASLLLLLSLKLAAVLPVRGAGAAGLQSICQALDPSPPLEPFVDALPIMPSINVSTGRWVKMGAYKITQKLHRDLPPTTLYAYGTDQAKASYPGPTLHATKNIRTRIRWNNYIHDQDHFLTVDRTIHWAMAKTGVPQVPHLHGHESESRFDGHPEAWWTAGGETGPAFQTSRYWYQNEQRPAILWYHDHTLGITRLNVLAGLAGFYILHDAPGKKDPLPGLPQGAYDIPLLFQDKTFWPNGSINFPSIGNDPAVHPNWCPEYFGDVMLLNGKAWPFLDVFPALYRFRLLNAANARFLQLFFSDPRVIFLQIGTDGGYLHHPLNVSLLTIAPAERVDVLVDFSFLPPGSALYLNNSAPAPFPSGDPAFSPPGTTFIIKFNVVQHPSSGDPEGSSSRNYQVPKNVDTGDDQDIDPASAVLTRKLTLEEIDDPVLQVPILILLGGKRWSEPVSETPKYGTTEIWEIINLTVDAHGIHIHLVRFKVYNWQPFDADAYANGTCNLASDFPSNTSCYTGPPQPPRVNQIGWKDTVVTYPGEVTRFLIRFTSEDGGPFPFNPLTKPGYVWHCHILDHEDNEMMRPLQLRR